MKELTLEEIFKEYEKIELPPIIEVILYGEILEFFLSLEEKPEPKINEEIL